MDNLKTFVFQQIQNNEPEEIIDISSDEDEESDVVENHYPSFLSCSTSDNENEDVQSEASWINN